MTVVHRLMERMNRDGFNETGKFSLDGKALPAWNSIGRLDIGSESLVDRSKSMKAYVMDLFERYGNESNIEGVDMYNACYGGQAAGLVNLSWVESDRWDGRYGLGMAVDIQDCDYSVMFCVGAGCTGSLFYPDAPLPHHSHRVSCILHRFDFFKPVGWHHMGPVVDGKYSIDAYMTCVETCYNALKKKMNDRPLLQITDYNVFHTGGGYHVVKKAFERFIRAEGEKISQEEREGMVNNKLGPSVHLLKIIGPCHTVSSFLNISSVVMSQWENALGKILAVFTYGSGCASSLYQLRFDDIAWFDPLAVWKVKFYREAVYQPAWSTLHIPYVQTWMKFDYKPFGRKAHGISYDTCHLDAYYLLEIDPWGRRFYHRGGMRAGPLPKEEKLPHDGIENRGVREKYGDLPDENATKEKEKEEKSLEDKWKELEFELTYDPQMDEEGGGFEIVNQSVAKKNRDCTLVAVETKERSRKGLSIEKDSVEHSYQIVGTWTQMQVAEQMDEAIDGSFNFEITLGANSWEQFYIVQDNDFSRKIYPAYERSWKDMPCVGPHKGPANPQYWMIDGRAKDDLPEEDEGQPGDTYIVNFKWGDIKRVTWEKADSRRVRYKDDGKYFLTASWKCFDLIEMQPVPGVEGSYQFEAQVTSLKLEFRILRNKDEMQQIYPNVAPGQKGHMRSKVCGADEKGKDKNWEIKGELGDMFTITLMRDPDDLNEIRIAWKKSGTKPLDDPPTRYFLVGSPNNWGTSGTSEMLVAKDGGYACEVKITKLPEEFQILQNKLWDKCIHPDKKECSQIQGHKVVGPEAGGEGFNWHIGKSVADKARVGDTFIVKLEDDEKRVVTWKKKAAE